MFRLFLALAISLALPLAAQASPKTFMKKVGLTALSGITYPFRYLLFLDSYKAERFSGPVQDKMDRWLLFQADKILLEEKEEKESGKIVERSEA